MTVLDVLQSTTAYFKKRNIEAPRLNAEHLLAHVLGRTRIELYLEFERQLGETALAPGNAARLGLDGRVQFRKNDLLENFDERFDLIVANLPYIDMEERQSLSREVLHDPEAALFTGQSGQGLIRRLIEQAPSRLH